MARSLAVFGLIISTLLSFSASALSIGEIELDSALNQPFSAGVSLTAGSAEELDTLQVSLAKQEAFDEYGLDRPLFLEDIQYRVIRTSATTATLRMEGRQPVVEPFVMMLVRFQWSAGNMLREYTVLLDPPVFDTAAPASTVDQPAAAADEGTTSAAPVQREAAPQVSEQTSQQASQPATQNAPATPVRSVPRQASFSGGNYGPIQNGSSLWAISERLKDGTGLSTNQMMIALYRANPEAFMGNINRLKAGSILRMPEQQALEAVSVAEANGEVQRQHQAWKSGSSVAASSEPAQLKLMPPSEAALAGDDGVVSSGAGTAGTGSASGSGDAAMLREELEETQRLLAIKDRELVELQERLAQADGQAGAAEEFPADDAAAGAADDVAAADAADTAADGAVADGSADADAAAEDAATGIAGIETDPDAATDDKAVAGKQAEKPADKPVKKSTMPAATTTVTTGSGDSGDSGSIVDTILGVLTSIWLWIVIGVLAVVGFVFYRSKQKPAPAIGTGLDEEEQHEALSDITGEFGDVPIASPVPDGYERDPASDSMVVEEGMAEDFLKPPVDEEGPSETTDEINPEDSLVALDGDENAFEVAPPDDFDIGLDTIGSDNQDDLLTGGPDAEVELEKTAELSPGEGPDPTATIGSETAINLDHADPIAEADFHMAYGLYDQAAELLVSALKDDPDDKMLRVKLLEVYFVWENKDGFITEARKLNDAVDGESDPEWNKVIIMGKQICPDDPLFAGAEGAAGSQILDVQLESDESQRIDMSFDADDAAGEVDLNFDPGNTSIGLGDDNETLDFDIGSSEPTMETPTIEAPGSESPTMETPTIEVPGGESPTMETPTIETPIPGGEETSSIELDDLEIDLGDLDDMLDGGVSGESDTPDAGGDVTQNDIGQSAADDGGLDFDIGFDESEVTAQDGGSDPQISDDDPTMLAGEVDLAEFIKQDIGGDIGAPDLDLGEAEPAGDTVEQPQLGEGGDTVEQPSIDDAGDVDSLSFSDDVFSGADAGQDAHGETHALDALGDDALAEVSGSGVDTKLDLARAYIDMGDPEGARSILDEVVDEGDAAAQEKARELIAGLGD